MCKEHADTYCYDLLEQNPFNIGQHIKKEKTFELTLRNCYNIVNSDFPCQIFTGSTKSWKRKEFNKKDIKNTLTYVKEKKINVFIHSIYLINFGRPSEECINAIECLAYDLELGKEIGAKGVVVHVGKSLKMGKDVAIDNMYNNIIDMLDYIDPSCPLLIETPANQGTELLATYEEFRDFYNKFTKEEKEKIKICIDTCHVFVAAKDQCPLDYMIRWIIENPGYLVLVHFNDSKEPSGSKKDRHAPYGKGHITKQILNEIIYLCSEHKIPMVREY